MRRLPQRWLWLLAVVLATGGARPLPRIGVGGGLRLGFGGVLQRAGLPFTYLGLREQCDPAALAAYDLVLTAAMWDHGEPWAPDALAALDLYLRGGGRVVCEMGARPPAALKGLTGSYVGADWPPRKTGREFALVGDDPLTTLLPAGRRWPYGSAVMRLELPRGAVPLARFVAGPARGYPAIVRRRYGRGLLIYLAADLSYQQGNWQPEYEDLFRALVTRLAGQEPQWSAPLDLPATPPPPTPAAADVPPPTGYTDLGPAAEDGYVLSVPHGTRCELWLEGRLRAAVTRTIVALTASGASAVVRLPARPGDVLIARRGDRLAVLVDGAELGHVPVATAPAGRCAVWPRDAASLQPLEAPFFGDDFARHGDVDDPWQTLAGRWLLTGAGPPYHRVPELALRGADGTLLAGDRQWADTVTSVAVQPRTATAIRLEVARWSDGDRLELLCPVAQGKPRLVRWRGGRPTVLAEAKAALPAWQWSRLTVRAADGRVDAGIDGRLLSVRVPDLGAGRIALGVDGGEAIFDDVEVRDATIAAPLPVIHAAHYDKGPDGLLDRDTWSHPSAAWVPEAEAGRWWHVGRFAGDFNLLVPARGGPAARLALHAGPERGTPAPVLAVAVPEGVHRVTLARRDGRLTAGVDGVERPVGEARGALCLGLELDGAAVCVEQIELRAADVAEVVFDRAPADWWEAEGRWQVGARWPCQPQWSWLAGEGTPRAVLWSKHPVQGDLVAQAFLSVRMLEGYGDAGNEPFERLRLTIAGDGVEPWSGYTLELGTPGAGLSRLYRKQAVLASAPLELPYWREVHNSWADLRLERHGARLTAWFRGRRFLDVTDPDPLPDGQVALWTEANTLVTPYLAVYGHALPARPLPAATARRRQGEQVWSQMHLGLRPEGALGALARLLPLSSQPGA